MSIGFRRMTARSPWRMGIGLWVGAGLTLALVILVLSTGPLAAQEGGSEGTDETPAATPTPESDDAEPIMVTVETCLEDPESGEVTCTESTRPAGERVILATPTEGEKEDPDGVPRGCIPAPGGFLLCTEEIDIDELASEIQPGSSDEFSVKGLFLTGGRSYKLRVSRPSGNSNIGFNQLCSARSVTLTVPAEDAGVVFMHSESFTVYACSSPGAELTADVLRDDSSVASESQTITVPNRSPTLTGDRFRNYAENGTGTVGTYTVGDPDGDTVTLSLSGTDALDFDIDGSGRLTFDSSPDYENPQDSGRNNIYNLNVVATDDGSPVETTSLAVTVVVGNVNEWAPVISGLSSITYAENSTGTVATYSATDADADTTITWSLSGTDALDFDIDSSGRLTFDSPPDFENPGDSGRNNIYNLNVVATDNGSPNTKSDTHTVTVTVSNVNEAAPVISGLSSITYAENSTGIVATYSAADADADTVITWSLSGTDALDFDIDSSGRLTFDSPPDFENPGDSGRNNIYNLNVVATDNGSPNTKSDTHTVTVTVSNVNEAAPVISGLSSITYAENSTGIVATYSAADADADTVITWSLSGTDDVDFKINVDGELAFKTPPDYEGPNGNVYNLNVVATDNGSPNTKSDTHPVTVTVSDVNEAPVISGLSSITYAENSTATVATYTAIDPDADTTITWSVSGTDAGDFDIDSSGRLTFDSAPDFENPGDSGRNNVYNLNVVATDNGSPNTKSDTHTVTVTVSNVNEAAPVISGLSSITYAENSTGIVATYSATDADADTTITWSLSGSDALDFDIDSSGRLTFDSPPDYENPQDAGRNNVYNLTVEATDNGSPTTKSDTHTVTVTVSNGNEAAPVISGLSSITYAENSTGIVATYNATDADADTVIAWSVSGTDAGDFEINVDGELRFKNPPDYENPGDSGRNNVYNLNVVATDNGQPNTKSDTHLVTVTVSDVNEAPEISGLSSITYAENSTGTVATYTATDPDAGDSVTLSLEGDDADHFELNKTTTPTTLYSLAFKSSPDYENPDDDDGRNTYEVTLRAKDSASPTSNVTRLEVTVTVANVDEQEIVITGLDSEIYIDASDAFQVKASDLDPDETYTITVSTNGLVGFGSAVLCRMSDSTSNLTGTQVTVNLTLYGCTAGQGSVTANVSGGDVNVSTSVDIEVVPPVPAAPTNVTATTGDGTITLSWDAVDYATEYRVYQFDQSTSWPLLPFGQFTLTKVSATSVKISGLTNGSTYFHRVSSVNSSGESNYTQGSTDLPVLVPEIDVVPLPRRKAKASLNLPMANPTGTQYELEVISPGGDRESAPTTDELDLDNLVNNVGLAEDGPFKIQLKATASGTATYGQVVTIIDSPITSITGDDASALVKWTSQQDATSYSLRWRKLEGSHSERDWTLDGNLPGLFEPANKVVNISLNSTQSTITSLEARKLYAVQLFYETNGGRVFSVRDAYYWASSTKPRAGERVAGYPFFGHYQENAGGKHEYKYRICEDTFEGPNQEDWIDLITDALEEWEDALPDLIEITPEYKNNAKAQGFESCTDLDLLGSLLQLIPPLPFGIGPDDPFAEDARLSEIRMLELPDVEDVFVLGSSVGEMILDPFKLCLLDPGVVACVTSPLYASLGREAGDEIISADISFSKDYLDARNVVPTAPDKVEFNMCFEGDTPHEEDSGSAHKFFAYALVVHEAGHALGLSDWTPRVFNDPATGAINWILDRIDSLVELFAGDLEISNIPDIVIGDPSLDSDAIYLASHPRTVESVMNYDDRTGIAEEEPDCSPYPLDIAVIRSLYHTD